MTTTKDFDTLKRKIYIAYHQDGILDLVAGSVVLGFGVDMLADNIVFMVLGWLAILFYVPVKQRITIPRFGYVRFDSEEKTLTKGLISLGIGVSFIFLIFIINSFVRRLPASSETSLWIQHYHMVPLGAMLFGLPALVVAIFLGLKRFYLYALLAIGLPALGAWLNIETFIPIIALGLVLLITGFGLLFDFVVNHPVNGEAGGDISG